MPIVKPSAHVAGKFVPHCDEEMQEWIEGRQRDLEAAMLAGQLPEVARIRQRKSSNIS